MDYNIPNVKLTNQKEIAKFLNSLARKKSQKTVFIYGFYLKDFFKWYSKSYKELSAEDLNEYLDYKARYGEQLERSSIKLILSALKKFYYFKRMRPIEDLLGMERADYSFNLKKKKPITNSEFKELLSKIKKQRVKPIVKLSNLYGTKCMRYGGLRVGEIVKLTRTSIKDALEKKQRGNDLVSLDVIGKGSREDIVKMEYAFLKEINDKYLKIRMEDLPCLFISATNLNDYPNGIRPANERDFQRLIFNASSAIGNPISPHYLRATRASEIANSKAGILGAQNQLRHKSIDTTMGYVTPNIDRISSLLPRPYKESK